MKIDFRKIMNKIDYIDIDVNTKYNEINFNKKSNITYVFGVNGSGKTSFCNSLNSENCDNDTKLFTYEDNIDISLESIVINKNIKQINNLKKELNINYSDTITNIISELKSLNIFSTGSLVKKFVIDNDDYFSNLCFKKNIVKVQLNLDDFLAFYKTSENELNKYKSIILENRNKNIDHQLFINENIDLKQMQKIEDLIKNLNSIKENAKNIFIKYLSEIEPNINIKYIKDIIDFLELNSWDIHTCPICDNSINLNRIKLNFKNIFEKNLGSLKKNEYLSNIQKISDEINTWNFSYLSKIVLDLNSFLMISTLEDFMQNLIKLLDDLNQFHDIFFDNIEYIKFLILDKYYIVENNRILSKFNFINSIEKINSLENEKIFFDEESVELIKRLISQVIGDKRLNISISNGDILIDQNVINSEIKLSLGEKNFVHLAFSLLTHAKDVKENKILLIDDPASSLDSNNKFNMLYIINYLANNFDGFKVLIFTHNMDVINTQFLCDLSATEPKLYILKNYRNLFWNDEETGFIEISIKDMEFLSLRQIRRFIISEIKTKEICDDFYKSNALTFTMILPIMRAFMYINDDENIDIIGEIMHYKKDILKYENNEKLVDIFKNFYKLNDLKMAKSILHEVLKFIHDFNENEKYDESLGFPIFESKIDSYSIHILESMRRMINMYLIRVLVEKELTKKISDGKEIINMRSLIDKSDLDDHDKNTLKCKRLLFNHYMHIENVPNLILPALEISNKNEFNEIKAILKIFKKESIWLNHN